MREHLHDTATGCPTELAISVVGQKWKLVIMERLRERIWRFGELQRSLSGITARMLTRQLRELEADGLVLRTVYPVVPPRVDYSMTPLGRSLEPVLTGLRAWGEHYRNQQAAEPAGGVPCGPSTRPATRPASRT